MRYRKESACKNWWFYHAGNDYYANRPDYKIKSEKARIVSSLNDMTRRRPSYEYHASWVPDVLFQYRINVDIKDRRPMLLRLTTKI